MYLLVIFLPLIGSILSGFGGFYFGRRNAVFLTIFCIFLANCLSFFIFFEVALSHTVCYIKLFNWINVGILSLKWGFLFDTLTSIMLIVVTFISLLVHIYSYDYMYEDPHLIRFMSYLSLFTTFMLILVTSDNFVQMFLGWEGVGLASYLLINFWFTRINANKAAIKAIILNRIGDFALIIAISLIYLLTKSFDYYIVFSVIHYFLDSYFFFFFFEINTVSFIAFLLFIGAVAKSAQIGLHTWLPDAMEGPTPVSALIHAATMVTAGVFIILRCSPIFEYCLNILILIILIGSLTCFFAATVGAFQNDLKKVIAYSTCSQLGYMVFICGFSNYKVSMFHLTNHAFFKALLFLSAGAIIHSLMDEQDMRKMGGLINLLPYTYIMVLIGSLALMGFPFLTGFYSKDLILEVAGSSFFFVGNFAFWLGSFSAFFTSFYSIRLLYLTFFKKPNFNKVILKDIHESSYLTMIPLFILSMFSIFFGYLARDMFVGFGTNFWNFSVFELSQNILVIESEFIPIYIKLIPLFFSLIGSSVAVILNLFFSAYSFNDFKKMHLTHFFYKFFNKKWYFDNIYNGLIVKKSLNYSFLITFQLLDKGILEIIGPSGLVRFIVSLNNFISQKYHNGYIFNTFYLIILGFYFCFILLFFI